MKPHRGIIARASLLALCLSLLFRPPAPSAAASARAAQAPAPRALVKSIVAGGREVTEVSTGRAQLTRADGAAEPALRPGLALYPGDTVETFADTRVTLLFLDQPVPERGNEVIIDADARVSIASTYSWWGTIWVKVKGAFNSRTKYVRLGVQGTEYEFSVARGEERTAVLVIDGSVRVDEGAFDARAGAARPAPPAGVGRGPAFLKPASFAPQGQVEFGRALDVPAGQVTNFDYTFRIENQCRQPHRFTFHTSAGADWLRVSAAAARTVRPGRTEPISATVTVDSTRLAPGTYRGRIYSQCVECAAEPQCNQAQLEWPINLTVRGVSATTTPTTPTPTPTPTPPTSFILKALEEATLTRGPDASGRADERRVLAALDWTNNVILSSQPSYPARNVLPHFADPQQRGQSFRAARQSAVLRANPPGSNKTLGDVRSDWGDGARAVEAYEKELSADQTRGRTATFMADLGDAYRLTGQFAQAQARLGEAAAADARAPRVLNARGNLSLDRARAALDRGDAAQARGRLEQARAAYEAAGPQGALAARDAAVVQTNLGEAHLLRGKLALRERNADEARSQSEEAAQRLRSARQSDPNYPFAETDLGLAFQRLGNAAALAGDRAEARAQYRRAESQHLRALERHPDMAEAHFHLGDLYQDRGNDAAAKESYWRAVRSRPEQPDAYFPLAVLLQDENPRLAAELAALFLQLLREEFRQGERARAAERIRRGERVTPPPRLAPVVGDEPDGDEVAADEPVVPDVVSKSRAEAAREIEAAGLVVGRVERRGGARDSDPVSAQRPAAGTKVARGSAVELVLGPGPERATVRVPEVKDDRLETARRKITERGLTVGRITEGPSCDKVGKVLAQNPRDGERVEPGRAVDLTIGSAGEDGVTLPNWVGRARASVEEEIRSAGLTVGGVSTAERENTPEGQVLRQSPSAGARLARGCEVKLEVAIPLVPVIVGDYRGMRADDALSLLSGSGLHGMTRRTVARAQPGTVVDQSHAPGSRVRKGTFVTLLVSEQQQTTRVPQVVGLPLQQAQAMLRNANLRWTVTRRHHSDYKLNYVFAQDPQPGQVVPTGAVVRLGVSDGWPPPHGGVGVLRRGR